MKQELMIRPCFGLSLCRVACYAAVLLFAVGVGSAAGQEMSTSKFEFRPEENGSGTAGFSRGPLSRQERQVEKELEDLSLSEIEERIEESNRLAGTLSKFSLRSGIGGIGYRSFASNKKDQVEWIKIKFENRFPIDQVVLVPNIFRDAERGFRADAFPKNVEIWAGEAGDLTGKQVATYRSDDQVSPRIGPLIIRTPEVIADWIKVKAVELSPRSFDGKFCLQLAEIMVFSGEENVALRRPLAVSSLRNDFAGAWSEKFLVDGQTPYLVDASSGEHSMAYLSPPRLQPVLTVDLGQDYPVSRIHLHAVDQSDTVPQAYLGHLGIPKGLTIEGASQKDFSDAKVLLKYDRKSIYGSGPVMMWHVPETVCRYIRFVPEEFDSKSDNILSDFRVGFAEIEIFSSGKNVALGKPCSNSLPPRKHSRSLAALTDGNNSYGEILPVRKWMEELAHRNRLEAERPLLIAELAKRYTQQKSNLRMMTWLVAFLTLGVGLTYLINRIARDKEMKRIKVRLAADLHDELGANLQTIALLGDLAQDSVDAPERLKSLHHRIRGMTAQTTETIRNFIDVVDAKGLYENLPTDMRRCTQRVMADVQGDFQFEGEEHLHLLSSRVRADLVLFYKECLVNIGRHSSATQFSAEVILTPRELHLEVFDNGRGLPNASASEVPASLKRRAKLMGATVTTDQSDQGGTKVCLKMKLRKWSLQV